MQFSIFSIRRIAVSMLALGFIFFGCEVQKPAGSKIDSQSKLPTNAKPEKTYELSDFIEGIKEGPRTKRLLDDYRTAIASLEKDASDQTARLRILHLVNIIGGLQRREGKEDLSLAAFRRAGSMARELMKVPEIAEQPPASFGHAFYNEACALALQGDRSAALSALEDAFSSGYEDVDHLADDTDLVSLKGDSEFVAKTSEWTKRLEADATTKMKAEIESFESYPYDFTAEDLAGNTIQFSDLKGKVVIVDYWGTWCAPCRAELPAFIAIQEKYGPSGFQMIGINCNERAEEPGRDAVIAKVKTFIADNKINYPCILDREKKSTAAKKKSEADQKKAEEKNEAGRAENEGEPNLASLVPDLRGFPTTLFFDRSGKLRLQLVGGHSRQKLEAAVKLLLDEPK